MREYNIKASQVAKWALIAALLFILVVGGLFGCNAGYKTYKRAQKRADAHNAVSITHILIEKANQQAKINRAQIAATKAEADKRYWEATGIRRAQDEISKTLTPLYVQHEAIQKLPEAKAIYVPSGANGIPQVYDVGAKSSNEAP